MVAEARADSHACVRLGQRIVGVRFDLDEAAAIAQCIGHVPAHWSVFGWLAAAGRYGPSPADLRWPVPREKAARPRRVVEQAVGNPADLRRILSGLRIDDDAYHHAGPRSRRRPGQPGLPVRRLPATAAADRHGTHDHDSRPAQEHGFPPFHADGSMQTWGSSFQSDFAISSCRITSVIGNTASCARQPHPGLRHIFLAVEQQADERVVRRL